LDNLTAQKAEEEARVERMQQDLDQLRTDLAKAEKEAVSSQRSLLVLQEKFADAESTLQGLKSQLCEVC
jgi:predicted  nucleic acid-binding Zn-ribbon protein